MSSPEAGGASPDGAGGAAGSLGAGGAAGSLGAGGAAGSHGAGGAAGSHGAGGAGSFGAGGAAGSHGASRRFGTLRLLGNELATLFRRWRTWAMLGALALIPILLAVALRVTGSTRAGRGPAFLDQITGNGLFVGIAAITVAIPLFLPLTVSVTAGDSIAGEASHGTLRYLLIAPAGRIRLLLVKYIAACAFCLAATITLVLVGSLIGWALFPVGPVTLLSGGQISPAEGLGRFILIAAYETVSLLGLAAIGLFLSTLTTVPVGAMAATAILAVASQIAGAIPQLAELHPYLFTDRWLDFADLLRSPPVWDSFAHNALLQAVYIAVFFAAAVIRFTTRDVLS